MVLKALNKKGDLHPFYLELFDNYIDKGYIDITMIICRLGERMEKLNLQLVYEIQYSEQ